MDSGADERARAFAASVLNTRNSKGMTPLVVACRSGSPEVVAFLLEHGADPLVLDDTRRRSALHWAALMDAPATVRVLLCRSVTVEVEGQGRVPLAVARVRDSRGRLVR